ncbi:dockerin type I domain-containing protein [Bythopirellula goksoeyrii]|nr:dockerin type I domain-containing protein [Bythopirellula goksoeyrii]
MNRPRTTLTIAVSLFCFVIATSPGYGVNLQFVGSQANLDNGFFPGGGLPYVTVPWRTSTSANIYATGSGAYPENFYGKEGYALFATTFSYPNANTIGGTSFAPVDIDDPYFMTYYPNLIDLPSWVSDSQILSSKLVGGYAYSLIDDPTLMFDGTRQWSFDGTNYPQAAAGNNTGQNPWVKMGFLDGADILGNIPENAPTGRWGFTVGPNTPSAFRIGVMTGGMDAERFAPTEVFLQQYDNSGATPVPVGSPVQTGTLSGELKDRFVDMHFFDIINAQEGDSFVFAATAGPNTGGGTGAGIAGFSFDVLPDPGTMNADFNGDGFVDGSDFLIWQRGYGNGSTLAQGDANDDGSVNSTDLTIWQDQYGTAPLVSAVAVPEPAAMVLLMAAAVCGLMTRR